MNWERVKISDCVSKVSTVNPSLVYNENLFKYVDIASIDNKTKTIGEVQSITGISAPSRARQVLEEGDILVSTVRPNLNAVALVTNELNGAIGSTGFCVLRPINNTLHPKYLFYWVRSRSFISEMEKKATGASYPAVSDSIIKNSEIPLPPIHIQQQIADTLDKADALRRKDQELLDKYDELAQAVFYEMFGDPVKNEKGWKLRKLNDISEVIMGQSPPGHSYNNDAIGYPLLNGPTEFGDIHPEETQWTTSPTKFCKKGDILFCVRGATAGRMNIADKTYCIGRGLAAIRPSDKNQYSYIYLFLQNMYRVFQSTSDGSTFINISGDRLKNLLLPDLPEKKVQVFQNLSEINKLSILNLKKSIAHSTDLFNSVTKSFFLLEI